MTDERFEGLSFVELVKRHDGTWSSERAILAKLPAEMPRDWLLLTAEERELVKWICHAHRARPPVARAA